MTELFGPIANVVLPIVLCVAVGGALAVLKLPFDRKIVGGIVTYVGYPALIISHLSAGHVALSSFAVMAGAALTALAVFVAASSLFLRLLDLPVRAFIAPMSLNNVGNVGLPVATLAFGDAGLSYSFAFLIVVMLGIFTYGTWVPRGEVGWRSLFGSPVLYAIAIALMLLATGTPLPKPLASAFGILGGLSIPLMLLTLGHTLATLTRGSLRRGGLLAGFHLMMASATGFALAALFGFSGTERGVFILMCMMPASVATYLAVEQFTPDFAQDAASLILLSTLLSAVALPIVLSYGF